MSENVTPMMRFTIKHFPSDPIVSHNIYGVKESLHEGTLRAEWK